MRFVVFCFMVNLSFVFSATISEWDDGNLNLPMHSEIETIEDIMSYLENKYRKNTNLENTTSKPLDDFNQVLKYLNIHLV